MKQEAKIGLFVVIAGLVMAYFVINTSDNDSILRFWQKKTLKRIVQVEMLDASGIRIETEVRVSGVQVGSVDKIELNGRKARVSLEVDADLVLSENAYATLQNKGVLGDKFVALFPGEGNPLAEGQQISSKPTPSLDDIMTIVHELGESVLAITTKFEESIGDGPDRNRFTTIATNIEDLSNELVAMVKENRTNLGNISSNFSTISGDLKGDLPQILAEMKAMISDFRNIMKDERQKISQTMDNTASMTERMNDAMTSVKSIAQKIDAGEGTIGKLINDNETADKVDEILNQASASLEQVQKYLASADAFQINLEFDTNYLARHDTLMNRFKFQIAPNENKYYQIDVFSGTRDYMPEKFKESTTEIFDAQGNLVGREVQLFKEKPKDYLFGIQFAYKFDKLVVRGGLLEETGGAGLDYVLLKDRLKMSMEIFDFNRENDMNSHGRMDFTFKLPKGLRVIAGWDDFLESEYQSFYFGAGIRWQDDDLKPLLASFAKGL